MDIAYEKMPAYEHSMPVNMMPGAAGHAQPPPPRIRHYFVFSLFSTLCLCPATGLIALAYSLKSSAKADVKFHDKARLYSRRALFWNILSVVFTVLSVILVMVFCNEMMKMYSVRMNNLVQDQRTNEINGEINRMIQSLSNQK